MEQDQAKSRAAPATPTLKKLTNALKSVSDWHSLGVNLDLSGSELATIERDYHGDSRRCKTEMLSRWLENTTKPAWEAIVEALRLMEADAVADTIQRKYITSTSTTEDPALATFVRQPVGVVGVSAVTSSYSSSSWEVASASLVAKENLRKIKEKFTSVLLLARTVLQDKNISVPDLRLVLVAAYVPNDESNDTREINPSRFIRDVLGNAQSIGEAFEALMGQNLLGFKNYHVLRPIVDNYAGEISSKLDEYEDELDGYFLVTTLQDYLAAELEQSQQGNPNPKLLDEFSVKVRVDVTDKRMKYIDELWKSLARRIGLPLLALPQHKFAKGCVEIVWLLPFHLTHYAKIQVRENTNYFREENVLRVTIAGRCIYEEGSDSRKRDKNEGNVVQERAEKKEPEGDPGAGNVSPPQRIRQLIDDEPEDPEAIPEHVQRMKCSRVFRTNYSLLYSGLDTERLLPKLPDKELINEAQLKSAKSYHQQFAQNAIVIDALLRMDRPSNGLLKFCDTLETTPGQEHIGKKLLRDYKCAIKHRSAVSDHRPLPSAATAVHSDLSGMSKLFQQLQLQVMDMLDHFPNALAKLKQVLASVVLPLGKGKTAPLVDPLSYEGTHTVRELFRLMSRYWNPLSTDLLSLLLEGSGYSQDKVAEFVEVRGAKGRDVLCIRQLPTLASGQNDLDVADLETVHNAPSSDLQSLHPAVFARLPEHQLSPTRKTIRISVEVDKPLLCIANHDDITTALSGFLRVPKAGLVYAGCCKVPLALCWEAFHELLAYITSLEIGISGHRLLVESGVTRVAIGDRVYKCPTLREMELLEACHYGLVRQVPYLLQTGRTRGLDVNVATFDEVTPLHCASQKGYAGIVDLLIQAGARVDLQNKDGVTPLYSASLEGHDGIVNLLIRAGARVDLQTKGGFFPLYSASEKGHAGIVDLLIREGATVDLQTKTGSTPLYIACLKGRLPVVERLIGAKADVNHQTEDGWTPLFWACQYGHLQVVQKLIGAKADVNHQKKDGATALMVASHHGHPSVVRALLQAGATINTTSQLGWTALYLAADGGHEDVVELLLEANADSDLPKKDSWETALMVAARKGSVGIVKKLVLYRANVNLTNKAGLTAFDIASTEGHTDVCQELLAQEPS